MRTIKWGLSILLAILLLAFSGVVLADAPSYDVYTPGKGMTYDQQKPKLPDGSVFQFCQDPGGATWRCGFATVQGGRWVEQSPAPGYSDAQRGAMTIVWSESWELVKPAGKGKAQAVITEIAPNPVVAVLPMPAVDWSIAPSGWFDSGWVGEFLMLHGRQPADEDYTYRYWTMLAAGG